MKRKNAGNSYRLAKVTTSPDYDLFTPEDQQRFLADYAGKHVAKRSQLRLDVVVLCAFVGVQLVVAAAILKRQDTI